MERAPIPAAMVTHLRQDHGDMYAVKYALREGRNLQPHSRRGHRSGVGGAPQDEGPLGPGPDEAMRRQQLERGLPGWLMEEVGLQQTAGNNGIILLSSVKNDILICGAVTAGAGQATKRGSMGVGGAPAPKRFRTVAGE